MAGDDSQDWYVAEGKRGQQLLDQGQIGQATEAFEAILARLGDTPSYARAVILGRLGRCFHMGGQHDLAVLHVREAIDVIGRLAPSDGVKSLRGTLRSDLGDALRAGGHYADARKAYEAALKIAEELNDLRGQGVDLGRLGALALAEGNLEEARTRQQAALRLLQQLHEPEMEAAAWHQLGRIHHQRRQWDEAERHYREAARISEERGHLAAAAQTWNQLVVLAHDAGKPEPKVAATGKQRRQADHFRHPRPRRRVAELRQGRDSRTTGPLLPHGQAARSGRSCVREAIGITATLAPGDGVKSLGGTLHSDLGDMLHAIGQDASAREAYEAALKIAEELQDLRGQAHASQRLGRIFHATRIADETQTFEVTLHEDLMTDYVFETDLLVDGPRERRIIRWTGDADPPADDVRPMLLPCTRTWTDDEGAVRFSLPMGDPIVERHPGCTVIAPDPP